MKGTGSAGHTVAKRVVSARAKIVRAIGKAPSAAERAGKTAHTTKPVKTDVEPEDVIPMEEAEFKNF